MKLILFAGLLLTGLGFNQIMALAAPPLPNLHSHSGAGGEKPLDEILPKPRVSPKLKLSNLNANLDPHSSYVKIEVDDHGTPKIRLKFSEEEVRASMKSCLFGSYFVEKAGDYLVEKLTRSEKNPLGVCMAMRLAIHKETEGMGDMTRAMAEMLIPSMVYCLLKSKSPEAVEYLKAKGYFPEDFFKYYEA